MEIRIFAVDPVQPERADVKVLDMKKKGAALRLPPPGCVGRFFERP